MLVLAKNFRPTEQDAAQLLQTWLRKAAGSSTGFEVKNDTEVAPASNKTLIVVGPTSLLKTDARVAALNDDGFLIHGAGSIISIEGRTGDGTYYGAVSFLDRYAGVRFYMPTDLWTSLPAES